MYWSNVQKRGLFVRAFAEQNSCHAYRKSRKRKKTPKFVIYFIDMTEFNGQKLDHSALKCKFENLYSACFFLTSDQCVRHVFYRAHA